ncbi:MAG TPA: response regulator [Salinimicrobium sp.]|nr:response regulator [Salinimicrobium sp.]
MYNSLFLKKILFCLLGSLVFFNLPSVTAQKIPKDSLEVLYRISENALYKHQYRNSIESAVTLLREATKSGSYYYQFNAYNLLGMSYEDVKDTARAKKYYKLALERAKTAQNDTLMGWAYNNLGNMYSAEEDNYQTGIDYYNRAIEAVEKFEDSIELLTPFINIAWTYLEFCEFDKAYPYLKKSSELFNNPKDRLTQTQLFNLWGMYHSGKNNEEQAREFFTKSLSIAEKDSLFIEASTAYKQYANFLYKTGDYAEAFKALQKHNKYQDKVFEKEKIKQIEAANAKFEVSEYRRNLELAQKKQLYKDKIIENSRNVVWILIGSAFILLVILVILYRTNKTKKALIEELQQKNQELITAKEEAVRLSNLKTQFFSTVNHELRTPLYGVVGLTSLLLEDKSISKHQEDLKSLKFSADYLLALINDVLQMNKMESNLVKLENMNFNLYDLMSSIVKSFEFTRLQNKNSIHLEIDKNIPKFLRGDSIRISQILMNLTGNAMKFTEDGHIWLIARLVSQEKNKSTVYFEVRDSGSGIPTNKQQEIFEEFSQLRNHNYNYQGTGLGLSIVKRLLQLFDSTIHVASEEGKGSAFSFEITFENGFNISKEKIEEFNLNDGSLVGKRILVVDDNRINRAVTKRILEKKGVVCNEAIDGESAINKIKEEAYDLVLMDINMPNINGLEATRTIRGFNKDLPIIALTAVEIEEMSEQIIASGMNDIIVKPYDIPQFFQTIMKMLQG